MQLEDYFIFLSPDDIRIKGHRIGIDNILFYFLEGYSPEEILSIYPDLSLEKIYATITYYSPLRIQDVQVWVMAEWYSAPTVTQLLVQSAVLPESTRN